MICVITGNAVGCASPEFIAGSLATAIVAVTGLLLTIFILKKILFKPLQKIMTDRQREIDETVERQTEQAAKLHEREEAIEEYERRQQEAFEERRNLEDKEVKAKEEKILSDAKASAEELLAEADRQITFKRLHEEERLYRQAVDLAVAAMSSLHERDVTPDQTDAIERSIREGGPSLKEDSLEA